MKRLYPISLLFLLMLLVVGSAHAQNEIQQRVERYLYINYNSTKAALRENERLIRILEEKLDMYVVKLDKETMNVVKGQDKEIKQFIGQVEKIKDPKALKQFVDETRNKYLIKLDKFVNQGLSKPEDALECRKIIVLRLVEHELIVQKQDKLLALLKDDYSRSKFIEGMLKRRDVQDVADMKAFTQAVDVEVEVFDL